MISPSAIASGTSCVTNSTVGRSSLSSALNSCCSLSRVNASTAANGSSSSSRRGFSASARAMPTRCAMPPDSWLGYASLKSARPTVSRNSSAMRCASRRDVAPRAQPDRDVLAHRHPREEARLLERHAEMTGWAHASPARRPSDSAPLDGRSNPAARPSSVLLPQPEGPTTHATCRPGSRTRRRSARRCDARRHVVVKDVVDASSPPCARRIDAAARALPHARGARPAVVASRRHR